MWRDFSSRYLEGVKEKWKDPKVGEIWKFVLVM